MKPYVDVLGTRYTIKVVDANEDKYMKDNHLDGYCSSLSKTIAIADLKLIYPDWTEEERANYQKHILRHELVHAYMDESGLNESALQYNQAWSKNEEMIDWIAYQFPKMLEAFKWLECL